MIAAGLKQAGRFKEVSLPILWELSQAEGQDAVGKRMQVHALRVAWDLYKAAPDQEGLRRRLSETGEKALAAKLEELGRK